MTSIEAPWIGKSKEDYDKRRTLYHCDVCGTEIKEGDEYYDFGDAIVCTNSFCALKFIDETYLRTAEDDGGY